jgi:prevent-host-death family protein
MCYMKADATVGVRELRQNLSIYLDRVKKGEALTVTEHGTAVALLRPLPTTRSVVDRLVAEGRARAPNRPLSSLPRPLRITLDRPLGAILAAERDDRL